MKYRRSALIQLDGAAALLATVNATSALRRRHLDRHRRLPAAVQPLPGPDRAAQGGEHQLLGLVRDAPPRPLLPSSREPSLLTLAPPHPRAPPAPRPLSARVHRQPQVQAPRRLHAALPLPDEAEAPLGVLIAKPARAARAAAAPTPWHDEVSSKMLTRRVEALTKERMWGGGGWGTPASAAASAAGAAAAGAVAAGTFGRRRRRVGVPADGRRRGGDGGAVQDASCASSPTGEPPARHAAARAVRAERARFALSGGRLRLPQVSDHAPKCASSAPPTRCPRTTYRPGSSATMRRARSSLTDFDVGERVASCRAAT